MKIKYVTLRDLWLTMNGPCYVVTSMA